MARQRKLSLGGLSPLDYKKSLGIRTLKKPIRVFSGTSKPFIIQNDSIKV